VSWSLKADLPLIKCPLLAIHGDKDEFGSIKHPKMICDLTGGPSQMHILQNCGHVPHREKTEEVLNLVVNFLQ
jgi:pimeloyl-ACP methyl ester carboxylesterase